MRPEHQSMYAGVRITDPCGFSFVMTAEDIVRQILSPLAKNVLPSLKPSLPPLVSFFADRIGIGRHNRLEDLRAIAASLEQAPPPARGRTVPPACDGAAAAAAASAYTD